MTDTQLYLAIGVPAGLFALSLLAVPWQARSLERRLESVEKSFGLRIDALQAIITAKFDAVYSRFDAAHEGMLRVEGVLDARLKHLEER